MESGAFRRPASPIDLAEERGREQLLRSSFQKAVQAHRAGKLREADAAYNDILRLRPNLAEAHYNLGMLMVATHRLSAAEMHFREALASLPAVDGIRVAIHSNLACLLAETGRNEEAEEHFRKALELVPDDALVHYNLGLLMAQTNRHGRAEHHLREAVRLRPDDAMAHDNLGGMLLLRGQNDQAEYHFRSALSIWPEDAVAHENLANLMTAAGRHTEAEEQFREVLKARPDDAETHLQLGLLLVMMGRLDDALGELGVAHSRRIHPSDSTARLYKEWAKAILAEGTKALTSRRSGDVEKWIRAFLILERRVQGDRAMKVIEQAKNETRSVFTNEQSEALESFLLGARLFAIEDPWEAWDALAEEASRHWPKGRSAVDVVREMRN
jgi:Flp pilus assembly protein TadD